VNNVRLEIKPPSRVFTTTWAGFVATRCVAIGDTWSMTGLLAEREDGRIVAGGFLLSQRCATSSSLDKPSSRGNRRGHFRRRGTDDPDCYEVLQMLRWHS
jgi:hypothetical protein